jgi:CheY-like chemotaxis protein
MRSRPASTAKKVLCVDDNESLIMLTQMALENAGYRVITESDGLAALRCFSSERVDAVVLDYDMPGLDGIEVAARMARCNPRIPKVLFSGCPELPARARGVVEDFVAKDGSFKGLIAVLNKLLGPGRKEVALLPAPSLNGAA